MSEIKVTKLVAETWTVRNGSDYAVITIDETIGSFSVQSSYVDGSHIWTSIGNKTLKEFVCGLDFHYMMGKLIGHSDYFYWDKTIAEAKKMIVECRWRDELDKEDAAWCWAVLKKWEKEHYLDQNDFYYNATKDLYMTLDSMETYGEGAKYKLTDRIKERVYEILGEDPCYICTGFSPSAKMFWERIWKPFVVELKKEIQGVEEYA